MDRADKLYALFELVNTAYMQLVSYALLCEQTGDCKCNCDSIVIAANMLIEAKKLLHELLQR